MVKKTMEWIATIAFVVMCSVGYIYFTNTSFKERLNKVFDSKPYVSFKDGQLYIDEFQYSVGITGINNVEGNFELLDQKVYDVLKGESGKCSVYLKVKSTDKYGNSEEEYQNRGTLDIDELNKYTSYEFWRKSKGTQQIILNNVSTVKLTNDIQIDTLIDNEAQIPKLEIEYTFNTTDKIRWQYFKIRAEGLEEITDENEVAVMSSYWSEDINNTKWIHLAFYDKLLNLTIKTVDGTRTYKLHKFNDEIYNNKQYPFVAVRRHNFKLFDVYFMKEDNCIMLSNEFLN